MEERNIRICEHPAVDNILSGYAKIAEQKEILIAWDVTLSKKLPIRDLDLIAILGNAMENAIHGCEKAKAETKQIHVLIRQTKQSVSVRIENTCPQTVFFSEGLPVRKNHTAELESAVLWPASANTTAAYNFRLTAEALSSS